MTETAINANVQTGGVAGVAGAAYVHIENLTQFAAAPAPVPPPAAGPIPPCPYPGLAYFGPEASARYFGRDEAIRALERAVARRSFTALVGASGSGKSSVVLAGLAPRLDVQGGWRSSYFRVGTEPDKNPFAALARALAPLLGEGDVVDRMTRAQKLAAMPRRQPRQAHSRHRRPVRGSLHPRFRRGVAQPFHRRAHRGLPRSRARRGARRLPRADLARRLLQCGASPSPAR